MSESDWVSLENEIIRCRKCPRLVEWREKVAREKKRAYREWEYWGKPVPGFGDHAARMLAIGLAPGAHGSNRTGRMFTGDGSGDFLYPALYKAGFASQPDAVSRDDGMQLRDLYISAICRCAPPGNKPSPEEIANCLPYLRAEIRLLSNLHTIVALGKLAYDRACRILLDQTIYSAEPPTTKPPPFIHGAIYSPEGGRPTLIASYHPSRQNTNTGKLTKEMFEGIWKISNQGSNH